MERFFPSRVIKNDTSLVKFFKKIHKKLFIAIMTSTMVEKLQNLYEYMHSGQKDLKLVLIKKL